MALGTIPRLTRTEAEQVAEHIFARWTGLTGRPEPAVNEEACADVVQAIFLKACTIIEERPEAEEAT
jgi:hypothetical protein